MIAIGLTIVISNVIVMLCCCKASGDSEKRFEEWLKK